MGLEAEGRGGQFMNDQARRKRAAGWIATGVLAAFLLLGLVFVFEIRGAKTDIWHSSLSASEKYLWFARLQTSESVTALIALFGGLAGASYAWRSLQKSE